MYLSERKLPTFHRYIDTAETRIMNINKRIKGVANNNNNKCMTEQNPSGLYCIQ